MTPTEIAERIVIEYANITGRDEQFRPFVRQAALTVLEQLEQKSICPHFITSEGQAKCKHCK